MGMQDGGRGSNGRTTAYKDGQRWRIQLAGGRTNNIGQRLAAKKLVRSYRARQEGLFSLEETTFLAEGNCKQTLGPPQIWGFIAGPITRHGNEGNFKKRYDYGN